MALTHDDLGTLTKIFKKTEGDARVPTLSDVWNALVDGFNDPSSLTVEIDKKDRGLRLTTADGTYLRAEKSSGKDQYSIYEGKDSRLTSESPGVTLFEVALGLIEFRNKKQGAPKP